MIVHIFKYRGFHLICYFIVTINILFYSISDSFCANQILYICLCTCWITINTFIVCMNFFDFFLRDLAFCKSSLKHLQLPYIRSTHKFDFFILFLAIWMDILTLICACGALTRTLSVCLDSMTGGMARIYILGRNAPENEPWPDVIGFSIIFIVSVMFMLGLEVITRFQLTSRFCCFLLLQFYRQHFFSFPLRL